MSTADDGLASSTAILSPSKMQPYPRSTVACRSCRLRKVRCSFSTSGKPCTNCLYDGVICEIIPRKKNGAKRKHIQSELDARQTSEIGRCNPPTSRDTPPTAAKASTNSYSTEMWSEPSLSHREVLHEASSLPTPQTSPDNMTDFSIVFDAQVSPDPGGNRALLYIGDQQAINSFVLDVPDGPPQSSCYIVPLVKKRLQQLEDLDYLRLKGCFTLLPERTADELVTQYFQFVHPMVPIINAARFLQDFVNHKHYDTNLLLLWSMFYAASSFIPISTVEDAGYTSRKDMKMALYRRFKYLFDSDFEEDKLTVVQATTLIAYFYTDTEDRTGTWHWIGTAISLCQSLGLHRDLEATAPKNHYTDDRLRLLRRIWWACFVRDRWVSLGHGRPIRIQLEYCDTPMPTAEDIILDLKELPSSIVDRYLQADQSVLATLWLKFINLSKALGNTIQCFYSLHRALPNMEDVKMYETEILHCAEDLGPEDTDMVTSFHMANFQLFHAAAIIVLYRPYLKQRPNQALQWVQTSSRSMARVKTKSAAAQATLILERLIEMEAVKWLPATSLAALTALMQIHLIEYSLATSPVSRNISSHKLQLCLTALAELRDNYWGAEVCFHFFGKAQALLREKSRQSQQVRSDHKSICTSNDQDNGNLNMPQSPDPPSANSDGSLLDLSQLSCQITGPGISDSFLLDPENFFLDQFALGSMLGFEDSAVFGEFVSPDILESGLPQR